MRSVRPAAALAAALAAPLPAAAPRLGAQPPAPQPPAPQPSAPAPRDSARAAARDSLRTRAAAQLGAVRVTGVRSGVSLRNAGPVPVDRVPVAPVANVGQQEVTQILNFVAPSFYSATQTQADGADHVDFASLRALGADQTLVLVNGRRRHASALLHLGDNVGQGTAGVDLNAVPAAAVERVEVLRDGAAAQYGSDAIAGVLNLVLRSDAGRPRVSLQAGQTTRGDGGSVRADLYAGRQLRPRAGGRAGFVAVTGELRVREPTQRVGRWNGNVYTGNLFNFGDVGPNGEYATEADYQADLARQRQRAFDRYRVQRIGDSRLANGTVFVNAAVPLAGRAVLGDSAEAYAFGGVTGRRGQAGAFYRFPADADVNDLARYPDGYLPLINSRIADASLAAGVRGRRGAWRYDLGTAAGGNRFDFRVTRSLNASLLERSPTAFDGGGLRYASNTARLDVARPVFGARAGGDPRANLAFGAEWRVEGYRVRAGEEASWRDYGATAPDGTPRDGGAEGFPGYQPANAGTRRRNNVAAYADLEAAVAPGLVASAAARAERYSDFGGRATAKVAALYRVPGDVLALRGAFNTGFRAPSLHQVATSKVSTVFVNNREVNSGLFASGSPVARALGVAPLRPETSRNVSGGVVLEPARRLVLQADGYRVDVDDRVVASGVLGRDADPAIDRALAALPDVGAVQFFTNAIDTRTQGVDAQLSYPVVVRRGVLALAAGANRGTTRIRGPVRAPAGLGAAALFNPQERSYIERAYPASKYVASARWQGGRLTALARGTRFGPVEAVNLFGPTERVPAAVIADANVGLALGRYDLGLGANNLFDRLPPRQDYANSYFGVFNYARVAPYGTRGRFVYVTLAARL